MIRTVEELATVDDPAWDELVGSIAESKHDVAVIPAEPMACRRTLHRLQMTAHSTLGGIALNSGGMLVDHGWIRVLGGSPGPGLPDIASVSGVPEEVTGPPAVRGLLVAYDVLGGQFAINGGGLAGRSGSMCYWAPDSLTWESFDYGHTHFMTWVLEGDHEKFYQGFRWEGWETETERLQPDQGYSIFPFMFTKEFDIDTASREPVPITELFSIASELAPRLGGEELPFTWSQILS